MKALFFVFLLSQSLYAVPLSKERVVLRTDFGDIVLALYPSVAPQTTQHFLRLARAGIYDTTHFFRVHPGFVAQVSDANGREVPLTPAQTELVRPVVGEFSSEVKHGAGTLSFARYDGKPDSGEVSFSILLGKAPHLDGQYTAFGEVVQGLEVMLDVLKVPRNDTAPLQRIRIHRAIVADNAQELASILREGKTIPKREIASVAEFPKVAVAVLVLVFLVGAFVTLFADRLSVKSIRSLHLVNVLAVAFALAVTLAPHTYRGSWVGASVCVILLLCFRLLSRFESA